MCFFKTVQKNLTWNVTRSSAAAKSTARPSYLVGVLYDISRQKICWWLINHFYVTGHESYRIRRNNAKHMAITLFNVIQGHRFPANIQINFTSPETRMIFTPEADNHTIVFSFVWTKDRNVTDRRTHRQRSALRAMRTRHKNQANLMPNG